MNDQHPPYPYPPQPSRPDPGVTEYRQGTPPVPPPDPFRTHSAPRKRRGGLIAAVAASVAALLAGVGIGAASSETTAEPAAAETVVPQACLDGLEAADDIRRYAARSAGISARTMAIMADAVGAIASFDWAAIDQATADIEAQTAKLDALAPKMGDAVDRFTAGRDGCASASSG